MAKRAKAFTLIDLFGILFVNLFGIAVCPWSALITLACRSMRWGSWRRKGINISMHPLVFHSAFCSMVFPSTHLLYFLWLYPCVVSFLFHGLALVLYKERSFHFSLSSFYGFAHLRTSQKLSISSLFWWNLLSSPATWSNIEHIHTSSVKSRSQVAMLWEDTCPWEFTKASLISIEIFQKRIYLIMWLPSRQAFLSFCLGGSGAGDNYLNLELSLLCMLGNQMSDTASCGSHPVWNGEQYISNK